MSENILIKTIALFKLKAWMEIDPVNRTQTFISNEINVSQPSISYWINGKTRPEYHLRVLIEILTLGEVKVEDWLTKEERNNIMLFRKKIEERKVA